MLRLFKFFVVFLVASLAAGFVGWAAMIHDEMADAELALATGRLEVAEKAYNSVLGKVEKIQFFFPGTADEIFSRQQSPIGRGITKRMSRVFFQGGSWSMV